MSDSPLPAAVALQQDVKRHLSDHGSTIRERVVAQLAEEEISRRVGLLREAVDTRSSFNRELNKLKPDVITYDDNGEEERRWTKKARDERDKLLDKLGKIDARINAVIEQPNASNYDQLSKTLQKVK